MYIFWCRFEIIFSKSKKDWKLQKRLNKTELSVKKVSIPCILHASVMSSYLICIYFCSARKKPATRAAKQTKEEVREEFRTKDGKQKKTQKPKYAFCLFCDYLFGFLRLISSGDHVTLRRAKNVSIRFVFWLSLHTFRLFLTYRILNTVSVVQKSI